MNEKKVVHDFNSCLHSLCQGIEYLEDESLTDEAEEVVSLLKIKALELNDLWESIKQKVL